MTVQPQFIALLTSYQNRMYAYILSLLADPTAAEEVLQQTNLVIWEKADQFTPGSDFEAWVMTIARFEVKAYRTRAGRERLVFGEQALARLEDVAQQASGELDHRMSLLHECFKLLNDRQRDLIRQRYERDASLDDVARAAGQLPSVIAQALYRARLALVRCMRKKLAEETAP